AAVRYPAIGRRGVGGALARAGRWSRDAGYLERANDEIALLALVESAKGLENLEAIARTPGIDAVVFGPSDLAASMGYTGQPGQPKVQKAIELAIERVAIFGKASGLISADEALVGRCVQLGASLVIGGVDTTLL